MTETPMRKIRISLELMQQLCTRDSDGNRLRVEWGEADAERFYTPTISVDYSDNPLKARIEELERAANLACDSVFRLTSAVMSSGRGADCANALRALDIVASDLRVAARGGEQSEIGCNGRALP